MNELSNRDWELINAYHDRELDEAVAQELESRFESEPALVLALKELSAVSSGLAALRPNLQPEASSQETTSATWHWQFGKWLVGGAAAAVLAITIIFATDFAGQPTALDIHAELANQTFAVDDSNLLQATITGSEAAPDLRSANLMPVLTQSLEAGQITHYAGRNGCRLTYFRGAFVLDEKVGSSRTEAAKWATSDKLEHMIVATGMDQAKFQAIAAYLEHFTQRQSTESVVAAVTDATTSAAPCVG